MDNDTQIKCKILSKLVRGDVTGGNKVTVDTAKTWVATHNRGRAEELIRDMVRDPDAPVEAYGGGARDNIRLTSIQAGVDYLKANDCEVPFGYD